MLPTLGRVEARAQLQQTLLLNQWSKHGARWCSKLLASFERRELPDGDKLPKRGAAGDVQDNIQGGSSSGRVTYELCRMDDNANAFVMLRFACRATAEAAAEAYQARGHKQVYVVRVAETGSDNG
jgi:hypothetical protein